MRLPLYAGIAMIVLGVALFVIGAVLAQSNQGSGLPTGPILMILTGVALLYAGARWITFGKAIDRATRRKGMVHDGED